MRAPKHIFFAVVFVVVLQSCTSIPHVLSRIEAPGLEATRPEHFAGLHQVVAYREGFYSGGMPEGKEGFDSLAAMGIKTIISVDGAVPDVAAARARGMKYIHLPIGYNGFDETRRLQIIKASTMHLDEGPVYLHCHHGKHRSAAAVGSVVVAMGWMTPEQARERMDISEISPKYRGLIQCVQNSKPVDSATLASLSGEFPEVAQPETFVEAMVRMDEVIEHLKHLKTTQWKPSSEHPDLVPAAEAGRLANLLRVSAGGKRAQREGWDFTKGLMDNEDAASTLEELIIASADPELINAQFQRVEQSCKKCHEQFRDNID